MVGLLLLKQLENLSDERVVVDIGLDLVNIFLSKTTKK
jgi:hypothetical protein